MNTNINKITNLLDEVSNRWGSWASVKKTEINYNNHYDLELPDFPEELIFFKDNSFYKELPKKLKLDISACGWLLFNQVTIALENEIVTPVLLDIIYGKIPGLNTNTLKIVAGQLLTDEAYHTLMVLKSNELTRKIRKIDIEFQQLEYVTKVEEEKNKYVDDPRKQWLIKFAAAVVAEHYNTKAIGILSKDDRFQPLNRLIVETHWKDELAHNNEFLFIAQIISSTFNDEDKAFFKAMLTKPVKWIHSLDVENWAMMLKTLDINNYSAILANHEHIYASICEKIDYQKITDLQRKIH